MTATCLTCQAPYRDGSICPTCARQLEEMVSGNTSADHGPAGDADAHARRPVRRLRDSDMNPLEVNRADLAWSLTAVLPHVGSRNQNLDYVGFYGWSEMKVYATDRYTAGVALVKGKGSLCQAGFALPLREAKDLLRFVKPTLVRHQTELVKLLVHQQELHVALEAPLSSSGSESEAQTAVFEVTVPETDWKSASGLIQTVRESPRDDSLNFPFLPDFAARFAKAARQEGDRLILSPRRSKRPGLGYGASYVTVGENFEGAVAGLTYTQNADQSGRQGEQSDEERNDVSEDSAA